MVSSIEYSWPEKLRFTRAAERSFDLPQWEEKERFRELLVSTVLRGPEMSAPEMN